MSQPWSCLSVHRLHRASWLHWGVLAAPSVLTPPGVLAAPSVLATPRVLAAPPLWCVFGTVQAGVGTASHSVSGQPCWDLLGICIGVQGKVLSPLDVFTHCCSLRS